MIATERQTRDDRFRGALRHDGAGRKCISHDSIVTLRVDRALIHADAGATGSSSLNGFTEALNDIRLSQSGFVLQGHQESARMRNIIAVILPRPGVDVNHSVRPYHHVAGVTNAIGEYGRAKSSR